MNGTKSSSVTTPEMEHQYYADFFEGTLRRLEIEDCILPELTTELATLKHLLHLTMFFQMPSKL